MTADDTLLTLSEAAEQCGVARSTIRRALDQDRFPNAVRDDDARGTWWVPVSDLLDAGYVPATPQSTPQSTPQMSEQSTTQGTHLVPWADVAQLVDRLADLQDARATAERDAQVAAFRQQQAEAERDRVTAELSEARAAAQAATERAAAAEQARVLAEAERTRLQSEADSRRKWGRRT
jgi:multidrug efflux pump subunit AcrA (membrane-fusion protein)